MCVHLGVYESVCDVCMCVCVWLVCVWYMSGLVCLVRLCVCMSECVSLVCVCVCQ